MKQPLFARVARSLSTTTGAGALIGCPHRGHAGAIGEIGDMHAGQVTRFGCTKASVSA